MNESEKANLKKRVEQAVARYLKKNDPNLQIPKRTNEHPERDLQREIIKWLNSEEMGWSVDNIESRAQFSPSQGRYIIAHQTPGLPDLMGNDQDGRAVFIELKAPGRRNTLRANQRQFLIRKIKTNCFAICADSQDYIFRMYKLWLRTSEGANLLLRELPPERLSEQENSDNLFD